MDPLRALFVRNDPLKLVVKGRNILFKDAPHNVVVDTEVVVDEDVSQAGNV